MSLEVDSTGATCVECGVFDFLPTTCPRCNHTFCRDHVSQHHIPAEQGDGKDSAAPPRTTVDEVWCTSANTRDSQADALSSSLAQAATLPTGPAGGAAVTCYLCPSTWCVLTPCTRCGHNFCAAHRFHGHEDADEDIGEGPAAGRLAGARARRFTPRVVPPALLRQRAEVPQHPLTEACAPFTKASPLCLAPPAYRSRMMELVALLCRRGAAAATGETPGCWQVAVCSLSVAAEAAVGQMAQRCMCMLGLAGEAAAPASLHMDAPELQALCSRSCPYRMACEARAGSEPPQLQLRHVAAASITKETFLPGEAFVLRVDAEEEGEGGGPSTLPASRLEAFLSELLLPRSGKSSPTLAGYAYVVRDDRVRAAVARLRLSANRKDPSDGTTTAGVAAPAEPLPVVAGPPEGPPTAESQEALASSAAPWPFHFPPPLASVRFHNTKASPLGAKQAPSNRVLVAVFTENRWATEAGALAPFVLAVGRDWPLGKVESRVKEEAYALLTQPEDRARACDGGRPPVPFSRFGLFLLGSASLRPPSLVRSVPAERLGQQQGDSGPRLKDGDVLFLGSADACSGGSPLMAEVARMQAVRGKELAAQQLEMMKKCCVM